MEMTYYKQYEPFFGSWSISKMLGEGSFGKVFEIERQDFGEIYKAALKIITVPQNESEVRNVMASGMDSAHVTEYFEGVVKEIISEFIIMSKLKGNSHVVSYEDHLVIPHEKKNIGWDILIRMELLTPLLDYAQNTELTKKDIMKLGIDMCHALELCQKHNIIHRDIKPENIFVSESENFKLGDFGIARTIEKTSSGMSKKGTYTYMAPEVYKGEKYGSNVDIYSLGVVLYRLLNNNRTLFLPPFPEKIKHSDIDNALIRRISGDVPPAPAGADGRLAEIVLKACSYNPKDRFSSPMQMRLELESILYEREESKIIYPKGDKVVVEPNEYVASEEEQEHGYDPEEEGTVSIFGNVSQPLETKRQAENRSKTIKKEVKKKTKKKKNQREVPHIIKSVIPIYLWKEERIEHQVLAIWNGYTDGVITLTNKRLIFVATERNLLSGKVSIKKEKAFKQVYKLGDIYQIKNNFVLFTPVASFNVRTAPSWFSSVNIQIIDEGDDASNLAKSNAIVEYIQEYLQNKNARKK